MFREETRAPGAAFKLPANPLSDLNPEDLASFVDCTLYESSDEEVSLDDEVPTRETPAPPPALSLSPPLPPVAPKPRIASPVVLPPAPAPTAKPPKTILPGGRKPSLVLRVAAPARRFTARAGLYILCVVGGLMGGRLVLSKPAPSTVASASTAVPASKSAPVAAQVPTASVPVAMPAPAPPATTPAPAPTPSPAAPARAPVSKPVVAAPTVAKLPAANECVARVETEPDQVQVLWGETLIGTTPLASVTVPCGAAKVTLRRDRYQSLTRDVTTAPGAVTTVSQKLHRPAATLAIGSSPANAEITINGQPQGNTPKKVSVFRYQAAQIKVTLPGYEPWTKTVYVRESEIRIAMQLRAGGKHGGAKAGHASAKAAAPPSAAKTEAPATGKAETVAAAPPTITPPPAATAPPPAAPPPTAPPPVAFPPAAATEPPALK